MHRSFSVRKTSFDMPNNEEFLLYIKTYADHTFLYNLVSDIYYQHENGQDILNEIVDKECNWWNLSRANTFEQFILHETSGLEIWRKCVNTLKERIMSDTWGYVLNKERYQSKIKILNCAVVFHYLL